MAKIYKRIGLRRDKNLGDLSNAKTALNNLLDAFAATGDDRDATFISEDLDCIRNIFAEGMTPSTYQQIGGSALESTTSTGENKLQKPRVTYINRLDVARVFAGEPRIFGGNGLTASYYDKDRVFEDTIGIWSGTSFKQDNFWENGNFEWTRKIHPSAADENGGVDWEGFFIPTETGTHSFRVNSTGCFTAQFETEGYTSGIGTYVEHIKVGIASTAVCSGSSGGDTISVADLSDMKNIGIGHSVFHSSIADDTSIEEISGQTLTLKSSNSPIITSTFSGQNVTFSRATGQLVTKTMSPGYMLRRAQRYRIRFRYFVPQTRDASRVSRKFEVDCIRPTGSDDHLRFTELYGLDYDFSDSVRGDFSKYLDTSVLFGGGTIGVNPTTKADPGNVSDYVTLKSNKKVDIKYAIKDKGVSYAVKKALTITEKVGSTVIDLDSTSNLEVGNYVYDVFNISAGATKAIPDGTRIEEIIINKGVILSNPISGTPPTDGSVSYKIFACEFVEHRGHVQRVVGNSPSGNSQVELTTDYPVGAGTSWTGRVLIGNNINTNSKIALNGTTNSFGLNYSVGTISSLQSMYIYESEGLVNNSLTAFCTPKQSTSGTRCVSVTSQVEIDDTTLPVSSTTDINQGDTVLGFYFASGTTVSSVDTNNSTITINQGATDIIKLGNNFTITRDSGDRSLCCPPKDTSPPFTASEEGMITKSPRLTMEIDSGNVLFGDWSATINDSKLTTDTSTVPGQTYNKEIPINCNGTTYKILAV